MKSKGTLLLFLAISQGSLGLFQSAFSVRFLTQQLLAFVSSFWPCVSLLPGFEDEICLPHSDPWPSISLILAPWTRGKRFHSVQSVTWSSLFEDMLYLGSGKIQSMYSSLCGRIVSEFFFFFVVLIFFLINMGRSKGYIPNPYEGLLPFICSLTRIAQLFCFIF